MKIVTSAACRLLFTADVNAQLMMKKMLKSSVLWLFAQSSRVTVLLVILYSDTYIKPKIISLYSVLPKQARRLDSPALGNFKITLSLIHRS